jgi:hypothetical protein
VSIARNDQEIANILAEKINLSPDGIEYDTNLRSIVQHIWLPANANCITFECNLV